MNINEFNQTIEKHLPTILCNITQQYYCSYALTFEKLREVLLNKFKEVINSEDYSDFSERFTEWIKENNCRTFFFIEETLFNLDRLMNTLTFKIKEEL